MEDNSPEEHRNIRFIEVLRCVEPSLGEIIEHHQKEYAAILPYVILADITRWIIDLYRDVGKTPEGSARVQRLLNILDFCRESCLPDIPNLIGASFLENLWQADAEYAGLYRLAPVASKRMLDLLHGPLESEASLQASQAGGAARPTGPA
jgi:hypothetical protein